MFLGDCRVRGDLFDVTALLHDDYVADVGVRLSLYKRLASAHDEAHVGEIAVEM